jgi:type I restriction enzyme S subunit
MSRMKKQKNVPELRFPEFDSIWVTKSLKEVAVGGFSNGVFNDPAKVGYGYRLINVKDMYNGDSIDVYSLTLLSLDEREFKKNKAEYGDIFFTRSSLVKEGIAHSNILLKDTQDITYDGHLIRLRLNQEKYLAQFIALVLKTNMARQQFIARGKTGTMTTIGQDDIATVKISVPTKKEQEKIASFLSAVDKKLTQLRRKKELLETYKRGLMQKLFSQQIRFKQDDGTAFPDWEEKSLGEVAVFQNGKAHENSVVENGNFIIVNSKFIATEGEIKKYSNEQLLPLNENDIVMVMSDVPNGKALAKCFYIKENEKFTLNQRICSLKARKNTNSKYLFYVLNRNKYFIAFDSGVSQTNLRKEEVLQCPILLPPLLEQQKIADFLTALDKKIETVSQQIHHTEEFKKGLLQKMFV